MAVYCGTDIIEIDRLKHSIQEIGGFRERVFTEREIQYCEARKKAAFESYAARFAAKEAVSKALGTGIGDGIGWKHIEILSEENGKPRVTLTEKAAERFASMGDGLGARSIDVSLSHCGAYAIAFAVIEG